jgi:hypothetical protein
MLTGPAGKHCSVFSNLAIDVFWWRVSDRHIRSLRSRHAFHPHAVNMDNNAPIHYLFIFTCSYVCIFI